MKAMSYVIATESDRAALIRALERMPLDDLRPCVFRLESWARPVTVAQRGYYYGVIVPVMAEATGYTPPECDNMLRAAFERFAIYAAAGDWMTVEREDITDAAEMSAFIDLCLLYLLANLHISVPEPHAPTAAAREAA
ncbi:MAG: hypothetical protein KDB18_05785 [Salinibacterium sp.]|nr:hypothetical protein [Salinibacterium sp.]